MLPTKTVRALTLVMVSACHEITPRMGLALGCVMEMAVSAIKER